MPVQKNKKLSLTPELLREIEIFSKHFLTLDEIAYNLGVKPEYFHSFCSKHKSAVDAVTSARSRTKAFVVGKLMEKVNDGNVAAIIFLLKTQFGFNDSVNPGFAESQRDKVIPKQLGTDANEAVRIYQEVMT